MPAKKTNNFSKVILNENVYIYKKISGKFYAKSHIETLFRIAKQEKDDFGCRRLDSLVNQDGTAANGKAYKLSALVLKYTTRAPFITEAIKDWDETKLAYFFLLDFGDYLVVAKKNISGLNDFFSSLEPLPYEVITTMLYSQKSLLEKFSMDNLDSGSNAMKAKTVESDSLLESFNYVGANNYILNFLRVNNENDRYTVSANTSRLSKSGDKELIPKFIASASELIQLIDSFQVRETPLDVFAKPYDYAKKRDELTPVSLTVLFSRFLDELDRGIITAIRYQYQDGLRDIRFSRQLKGVSQFLNLVPGEQPYVYEVDENQHSVFRDVHIRLNENSIRLSSERLRRIRVYREGELASSLIDYINNKNTFFCQFR